jgi:hypothetical protein
MCNFLGRKKKRILLLTGAGASIAFGYPSTQNFTTLIEANFKADPVVSSSPQISNFLDQIISDLKKYFVKKDFLTFENIYQAIQDVMVLKNIPNNPKAFNEFRPHIGATHDLKAHYANFTKIDGDMTQDIYLTHLLQTFLNQLSNVSNIDKMEEAIRYLDKNFVINSFTLNYDNLIQNCLGYHVNGFTPGKEPRSFDQNLLLSEISGRRNTHCHLHGSLKWGFPTSKNPFEIHEYDSPSEGVKASKSRPSGRPVQRGETIPVSPIITGMDKTELVFRKPFYSNFLALFRSLEISTEVLIAGYGFSDRHVNLGIEQCRISRPDVRTYIVDYDIHDMPSSYINGLSPDAWNTILPGDPLKAQTVPGFDGWWKIPGINHNRINTNPIFLWLKGFDAFCMHLCKSGLPT